MTPSGRLRIVLNDVEPTPIRPAGPPPESGSDRLH